VDGRGRGERRARRVALGADPATAAAGYRFVDVVDRWLVIPLAFAALVSGVVVALVSPWGLTRYWWVPASCRTPWAPARRRAGRAAAARTPA
jgi:hypothetical protein